MIMNETTKKEKLVARLLFWSLVVPITFSVFIRLFYILFNYVYGILIVRIIGQEYANTVSAIAVITSLVFTIGVIIWIHQQYKKHILSTF